MFLLFAIIIGTLYVFYQVHPPFGGKSNAKSWRGSKNFNKKIFLNQVPTAMTMRVKDMWSLIHETVRRGTLRQPKTPLRPEPIDIQDFLASASPQLIWLGHSSVLLRVHGKTILTDPILSKRASPFSFIGPKRTISDIPISAEELPPIDAILISHDHYDHLDYATIRKLSKKTTRFFVPLGLAAHLRKWGIKTTQIEELDWWETRNFEGLGFSCTPSRHFSGRKLGDRFKTLWCSWVINTPSLKLFFSGDTGYGPHFKEIGKKYGPFDLTLMECGQYDTRWPNIHMMPEQTVQAHQDLGGKRMFPIHWGAFSLALHPWNDSVERAKKAGSLAKVKIVEAKMGELLPIISSTK